MKPELVSTHGIQAKIDNRGPDASLNFSRKHDLNGSRPAPASLPSRKFICRYRHVDSPDEQNHWRSKVVDLQPSRCIVTGSGPGMRGLRSLVLDGRGLRLQSGDRVPAPGRAASALRLQLYLVLLVASSAERRSLVKKAPAIDNKMGNESSTNSREARGREASQASSANASSRLSNQLLTASVPPPGKETAVVKTTLRHRHFTGAYSVPGSQRRQAQYSPCLSCL